MDAVACAVRTKLAGRGSNGVTLPGARRGVEAGHLESTHTLITVNSSFNE